MEALEKVIENSSERTEAAEATGILAQVLLAHFTAFYSTLGGPSLWALKVKHINLHWRWLTLLFSFLNRDRVKITSKIQLEPFPANGR